MIASYEVITKAKYGQGLFSNAMVVSWNENAKPEQHLFQQLFIGLSFAGGCLFSVLFYAPLLKVGAVHRTDPSRGGVRGRLRAGGARSITPTSPNFRILIIGLALFVVLVPLFYFGAARKALPVGIAIEGALFVTIELRFWHWLRSISSSTKRRILLLGLWVFPAHSFLRQ